MKNILFVYLRYEGDIYMDSYEQDHLGIQYMASGLRNLGYNVNFINAHFHGYALEEVVEKIEAIDYDLLCIPVHIETLYDLHRLSIWNRKNKKAQLCIGGHWAGTEPDKLLKILPDVDYVLTGEGEKIIIELVKALESNQELATVKGIAWRNQGEIVVNERMPLIADLDELPYPIRDSLEAYKTDVWDFKKRTANVLASRGCYGTCSFCSINSFYKNSPGRKVRYRNPIKVVDEIEYLVNTYRVNQIFFSDDNFVGINKIKPGWVETFANEVIRRELNIRFIFMCRVDDVDLELFRLLKQAGLVGVAMGIESDVNRMLKTYGKGTNKGKNRNALSVLRQLKIDPLISFMMFDPYTTVNELRENLDFFKEIKYSKYYHYTRPLTLLAGYDLKTYGGTELTMDVVEGGFTSESEFSYECIFEDDKTDQVFDLLQRWRPMIMNAVMYNPLWLIDIANRLNQLDLVYKLHALSRKLIKYDEEIFWDFIDLADKGYKSDDPICLERLHTGEEYLNEITKKYKEIEEQLEEIRKKRIEEKKGDSVQV